MFSLLQDAGTYLWCAANVPRELTIVQVGSVVLLGAAVFSTIRRGRGSPESQVTRIRRGTDVAITTRVHRLTPAERARIVTDEDGSQFLGKLRSRFHLKASWVTVCLLVFWLAIRLALRYGDSGVSPEREETEVFVISTDLSGLFQTQVEIVQDAFSACRESSRVCCWNYPAWAGAPDFYPCMIDSGIKLGNNVCHYITTVRREWRLQYALLAVTWYGLSLRGLLENGIYIGFSGTVWRRVIRFVTSVGQRSIIVPPRLLLKDLSLIHI